MRMALRGHGRDGAASHAGLTIGIIVGLGSRHHAGSGMGGGGVGAGVGHRAAEVWRWRSRSGKRLAQRAVVALLLLRGRAGVATGG